MVGLSRLSRYTIRRHPHLTEWDVIITSCDGAGFFVGQKIEFVQNPEWDEVEWVHFCHERGRTRLREAQKKDGGGGMEKTRNSPSVTSDTQRKHRA